MTVATQPSPGLPEPDGPAGVPSAEPPGRQRRGRRRSSGSRSRNTALILAAAGAAVLLAAAVFGYRFVSQNVLGPQAVVEDYLTALSAGDQAAAYALLPQTGALIPQDPAAYAAAGRKITGFEIVAQETAGGSASVQALVDQDGRRSSVEFRLREAGRQGVFFTVWQLEATAARTVQVDVPAGTARIRINGTDVALPPEEDSAEVLLLPGSYLIEGPQERYLAYGPARTVFVEPGMAGNPGPVHLRAAASGELATEVQAQAQAYLTDCLARREASPAACPNIAYTGYGPERIRDVQWVLEREPEYRITGTADSGLTVYATGGKARALYAEDTTGDGRWESRSDLVNLSFGSEIVLSGDVLGLHFRP